MILRYFRSLNHKHVDNRQLLTVNSIQLDSDESEIPKLPTKL